MKNRIKLLRSPLIVNAYHPLERYLPDDISLEDALIEANEFCREHNTWSGFLHLGNESHFISGGQIVKKEQFPWKVGEPEAVSA